MSRTTTELSESVRSTLRAEADALEITEAPFDPSRAGIGSVLALDLDLDRRPGLPSRSHRPRMILAVAAVVCIVAAGVAVLVVRHPDSGARVDSSVGQPDATAQPLTEWLPAGPPESARPATPPGWQLLDFGDFRFAVPTGWPVSGTPACWTGAFGTGPAGGDGGLVIARSSPGVPVPTCAATHLPTSWLIIEGGHGAPPPGRRVPVGTLTAAVDPGPTCLECREAAGAPASYHFDDGYTVSAFGPEAQAILDTFTDSGVVRILQSGPTVDTSTWQTITFDGVALDVPSTWSVADLAASHTETTDASGAVTQSFTLFDPGACGGHWFADRQPPQVFTGTSGGLPSCPYDDRLSLTAADGAWVRDTSERIGGPDITPVSERSVADVTVTIGQQPSVPAIDVVITNGPSTVQVTIGVGDTQAVARTILRSIRAA